MWKLHLATSCRYIKGNGLKQYVHNLQQAIRGYPTSADLREVSILCSQVFVLLLSMLLELPPHFCLLILFRP